MHEQQQLSSEMAALGRKRYWKKCQRVLRADVQAPHLKFALRHLLGKCAAGIYRVLWTSEGNPNSPELAHYNILREINVGYLAHITLVSAITAVHSGKSRVAQLAKQIGLNIEAQLQLRELRKVEPKLYKFIHQRVQKNTTSNRRTACLVGYARRYGFNSTVPATPELVLIQMGLLLLATAISTTGLFRVFFKETQNKRFRISGNFLTFTDEALDWFQKYHDTHEGVDPVLMPRVEPAPDWSEAFNISDSSELPAIPFIKHRRASDLQKPEFEFSKIYRALNLLQQTAWKINTPVFEVANAVVEAGWVFEGIDGNQLLPFPEKPEDIKTNTPARQAYAEATRIVYEKNVVVKSNILRTRSILNFARKFKDDPKIFFQYNVDFRGRTYALQHFLSPQGCDLSRGMLCFAEGKKLGSENAKKWLAIHGANVWGMDKHIFQERLQWVEDNTTMIVACATDPLQNREWTQADCPFQFLAFCFEWKEVVEHGLNAITSIAVQIDGSNNGLQILSLLSRDEITGAATNCTASEELHDIYGEVATELKRILNEKKAEGDQLAADVLLLDIDRKTCKRSVMTTPYGLTAFSSNTYVLEWLKDLNKEKNLQLPIEQCRVFSRYIGKHLWKAIQLHLGRSKAVMGWLQGCAKAALKAGLQWIEWTTPTGFVVRQHYTTFASATKEVASIAFGTRLKVRWSDGKDTKPASRPMVTGISPNFVHSLDAACLHLAVLNAAKLGIKNFLVIHDSFGTLAPDVEELGASVRFAYASVFKNDQLNIFASQLRAQGVEVPQIPAYGTLDVSELLDSDYVFA